MTKSASIIPQNNIRELKKIEVKLLEKHRDELQSSSWWKRILIRLKISREANRIFLSRLYASSGSETKLS